MSVNPHLAALLIVVYDLIVRWCFSKVGAVLVEITGEPTVQAILHIVDGLGSVCLTFVLVTPVNLAVWTDYCGLKYKEPLRRSCAVILHAAIVGAGLPFIVSAAFWGCSIVWHSLRTIAAESPYILALIMPVAEEIVYTGFLYKAYRARYGVFLSMLFVAVPVLIAHREILASPAYAIDVFITTAVFCGYREVSSSVWPSLTCHICYNAVVIFFSW